MENTTVSGLRSRSRSKTPFLRSSCDRENCAEGGEHTHHKSGRKTPVKRSTPVKQLGPPSSTGKATPEPIIELDEEHVSPPAHRTRQSMRSATEKLIKTSDYSSEESPDRLKASQKEISQNQQNYKYEYERVTTSQRSYSGGSLADIALSPINTYNASRDRSRFGSPAYSACSTDSSFAEQALADASVMQDRDPQHSAEHLPYRLYKMAGEYWNKYPKTDYTYSPLSRDRVELAPGQIAVPNMSRRSLSQFRLQGPVTSPDEVDLLMKETAGLRKRYTSIDSSDDDTYGRVNGGYTPVPQRWWITTLVLSIITTLVETTTSLYRRVVPPPQPRYPYRGVEQRGVLSRAGSVLAAPFYWVYTVVKTVVTTTVTTVTETVSPTKSRAAYQAASRREAKRRWWPWLLLLLLPVAGYGSYYTYENYEHLAFPNFTDFQLDLTEFSPLELSKLSLSSLPSLPSLPELNISMPTINITLPTYQSLPEVSKTYYEYKVTVQNRMSDASDYAKVVADSCFEEMRRFWSGVLG